MNRGEGRFEPPRGYTLTMRLDPGQIEVVDDRTAAILRTKSGAERLEIADRMFHSARQMLLNMLRGEHPDWSDDRIAAEAAKRLSHGAI